MMHTGVLLQFPSCNWTHGTINIALGSYKFRSKINAWYGQQLNFECKWSKCCNCVFKNTFWNGCLHQFKMVQSFFN
jgi:hypothetical protein